MNEDGTMELESNTRISGDYPKSIAILPDDRTLVSLNHDSNEIRTFPCGPREEVLPDKNPPIKVDKPNSIQIHKLI